MISYTHQRKNCGLAAIEFALILPVLLLLALAVFDFSRAMQAKLIVINVSREGASLAARSSLEYSNQQIMNALTASTPPLNMASFGMIYITKIMGVSQQGAVRNVVVEQYRWAQGYNQNHYAPSSSVWNCGSSAGTWASDGSCQNIPSPGPSAPTANVMTNQLNNGDLIYAVEVFYNFQTVFSGRTFGTGITIPQIGPTLDAMTVM
ncbi:MAG: TadE/TadG family type IV pilus assembly protein [Formivibrio sp.]|nr:TadE/TadG family type IV pilus assembly protein [Formivibrio sp.]